jgi:hypothetical protein
MYGVELYGRVRLAVLRDGMSRREAARVFGIDRGTVAKILKHSVPPGYQRVMPVRRPKLADHVGFIDQILDEDEAAPRKQRSGSSSVCETSAVMTAAIRRCSTICGRAVRPAAKCLFPYSIRRATRRPTSARP